MNRLLRTIISSWRWLRTTLIWFGILNCAQIIYFSIYGLPNFVRNIDNQILQDRIMELGSAVADLQDFKQVVLMKEESARIKLAKK